MNIRHLDGLKMALRSKTPPVNLILSDSDGWFQRRKAMNCIGFKSSWRAWHLGGRIGLKNILSQRRQERKALKTNFYDAMHRRTKRLANLDHNATLETQVTYIYDGFNCVFEICNLPSAITPKAYVWGNDISGNPQSAGGVGGLVAVIQSPLPLGEGQGEGAVYYAAYDARGNITAYTSSSGALAATFDYLPFGALASSTGNAAAFSYRFSTKPFDPETGLAYYNYRYYSPELGRWFSRDPLGEMCGMNLLGFVDNNAINYYDNKGRQKNKQPRLSTPPKPTKNNIDPIALAKAARNLRKCRADAKSAYDECLKTCDCPPLSSHNEVQDCIARCLRIFELDVAVCGTKYLGDSLSGMIPGKSKKAANVLGRVIGKVTEKVLEAREPKSIDYGKADGYPPPPPLPPEIEWEWWTPPPGWHPELGYPKPPPVRDWPR